MKRTIAVIGSAAALTFAGAGIASAEENGNGNGNGNGAPEASPVAEQICGAIGAYDFLGSAVGIAPGLDGEECLVNADAAIDAAFSFEFGEALDILRGDVADDDATIEDPEGEPTEDEA